MASLLTSLSKLMNTVGDPAQSDRNKNMSDYTDLHVPSRVHSTDREDNEQNDERHSIISSRPETQNSAGR